MLSSKDMLDSLYTLMKDSLVIRKKAMKDLLISKIVKGMDSLKFKNPLRYKNIFRNEKPNNAYFLSFVRYDSQKARMREVLIYRFNGDIRKYIEYLRAEN
jgi:hypothetical protein